MGTILVTWELGGGLGHTVRLAPVLRGLRERGHTVFAALRDLSRVDAAYNEIGVTCLQAPIKTKKAANYIEPPRTFPHILHNVGFGDFHELRALSKAWRDLYDLVRPDLILFDHSPTALLAARACEAMRAVVGTGFCCPPDEAPFRDLRPWLPDDSAKLARDEQHVLEQVNRLLAEWELAPLDRLSQFYAEVDETFLCTFPELDHYPGRRNATYRGAPWEKGGKPPVWPEGDGRRVYAYLKSFPALPNLLEQLASTGNPAVLLIDGVESGTLERHQSPTIRFEQERLDMSRVAHECDLAILNGGHGSTAAMLMHGKPILEIPILLEQLVTSRAVVRLGAGLGASPKDSHQIGQKLMAMLTGDHYAQAARRFAAKYADFDPGQQIESMTRRLDELVA